ncbi:5'/3'-nucleotidase SurE [Bacteroidia bacterium]|jgi:5'-nucleotidase|nr:5'/3'-nucleotidase SurE [Bacteroidia bacterium]
MIKNRPLILISNDDGITAPGILATVDVMKTFGDVVVVAPDSPQSAMGHAISINKPLRLIKNNQFGPDVVSYHCSGTPADCVKMAVDKVLDRKPDLLVSGINHGSNASINVLYSGTMSAAMEGAIEGMTAIGFSLTDFSWDADFSASKVYMQKIVAQVLANGLSEGTLLSVNIPNVIESEIMGIKICRQARAKWEEDFLKREDPHGKNYYWMTGKFLNLDGGEDTDEWALAHNYVSVVPVQFDLTAHHAIQHLNTWQF